jgi:photosynthetic reaction center cytochrome c subunit
MNVQIQAALAAVGAAVVVVGGLILATTERPPIDGIQRGYRGTGLDQLYNPRFLAAKEAENVIPVSLPRLPTAGAKAGVVYKNVQVLKDVSVGNFTRLMASMTNWVAPQVGCAYCHDVNNMQSDALYTMWWRGG